MCLRRKNYPRYSPDTRQEARATDDRDSRLPAGLYAAIGLTRSDSGRANHAEQGFRQSARLQDDVIDGSRLFWGLLSIFSRCGTIALSMSDGKAATLCSYWLLSPRVTALSRFAIIPVEHTYAIVYRYPTDMWARGSHRI